LIENYIFQHLSTVAAIKTLVEYPTTGATLVSNGLFTTVTTGWTAADCTLASVAGGQDGNCLQITSTGGATQSAYQGITLVSGKSYRVSYYVKSGTAGDDACIVSMTDVSTGATMGSGIGISSGAWIIGYFDFTATDTDGRINLVKNTTHAGSPGTMLFDTITVYEILAYGIKIYPLKAPQNTSYPFIVYQRISTNPDYTLGGFANLSNVSIQFDCYATDHAGIRTLSSALHTAMQAATFKNILDNDMDFIDPDLDGYRVTQDYSIWINE
jgi:hypothetical protein